jgi:hypothetical protein
MTASSPSHWLCPQIRHRLSGNPFALKIRLFMNKTITIYGEQNEEHTMAEIRNKLHEGTWPEEATMKFEFQNPTRLIFGAGMLSRLGEVVREHGKRALLVTGGGSVKRSGAFDLAVASLKAAGVSVAECSGVEPNPRLSSVVRGARIARGEGCDVVIGMGGGITMDAAKVMAAAVFHEGDPWDMIAHGQENWRLPTRALPIITMPTLAATGSKDTLRVVRDEDGRLPGRPPMSEAEIVEVLRSVL